ncbi:hypothetical protein [Anaerotalea alkaliphila]|uniref:Uncharacterized protein n=1 Tax=Anaerotalea alkaliphila TaxID=2662126 RepID=A0A7X5HVF3_9FIRM|nr:hypothetical protein [Anaerotalea alkaliphila]NDL67344.1 hypothetical protein [Anaerotalea alkaliphila]
MKKKMVLWMVLVLAVFAAGCRDSRMSGDRREELAGRFDNVHQQLLLYVQEANNVGKAMQEAQDRKTLEAAAGELETGSLPALEARIQEGLEAVEKSLGPWDALLGEAAVEYRDTATAVRQSLEAMRDLSRGMVGFAEAYRELNSSLYGGEEPSPRYMDALDRLLEENRTLEGMAVLEGVAAGDYDPEAFQENHRALEKLMDRFGELPLEGQADRRLNAQFIHMYGQVLVILEEAIRHEGTVRSMSAYPGGLDQMAGERLASAKAKVDRWKDGR